MSTLDYRLLIEERTRTTDSEGNNNGQRVGLGQVPFLLVTL